MLGTTPSQGVDVSFGTLPAAARQWLGDLEARLGAAPLGLLLEAARPLVRRYARSWGLVLPEEGSGWSAYERRVAATLAYHWWRYSEPRFRPLDEVIALITSGRLAYGRYEADVVRDVLLAEACIQQEPGAAERFLAEFGGVIAAEARRCDGPLGEQEIEGIEAQLLLPREGRPPRLALYAGHTPLKAWLRQVVRHEWATYLRRVARHDPKRLARGGGLGTQGAPPPDQVAQDHECLELLHPIFSEAAGAIPAEDAVLLRMVMLDGVPQNQVARLRDVHKSTITRQVQRALQKVLETFRSLAERSGRGARFENCLDWLLAESREGRLALAGHLAESVRKFAP
jgi:DNA-directed RNA polymerase specialized sigma24 family protein